MGKHRATIMTPAAVRKMVRTLVDVKRGIVSNSNREIGMADGSSHIVRSHAAPLSSEVTAVFPIVTPGFVESTGNMYKTMAVAATAVIAVWLSLGHYLT